MSRRNWVLTVGMVGALLAAAPTAATSQAAGAGSTHVFVGGYFYDPSFGAYPWWPRGAYPAWYSPTPGRRVSLRLNVTPKNAAVFIDGFYAGIIDDFSGPYDRLAIPPGGHTLVLFVEGYCTVRRYLLLSPGLTSTVNVTMGRLAPGVRSEPPPAIPVVPAPPPGSFLRPRTPSTPEGDESDSWAELVSVGTLQLRVRPSDATVLIDRQLWATSEPGTYVIQLPAGSHDLEITKPGYRTLESGIEIREAETIVLNVTLKPLPPRRPPPGASR